jgi:hypothetical protein
VIWNRPLPHLSDARPGAYAFAGPESAGNIRLCERAGYRILRRESVNDRLILVFMEKVP